MLFWFKIGFIVFQIVWDVCGNENDRICAPTSSDIPGPYYIPNPRPLLQYCTKDSEFERRKTLIVHGHVYKHNCRTPFPRVRMEIWQADHEGNYTTSDECRGFLRTDKNGYYEFSTIHPGKYRTHPLEWQFRPAHIHFKVFGRRGHKDLVTQMYFAGDSNLGSADSCSVCNSDKQDLIVPVETFCDGAGSDDCIDMARFDIVLGLRSRSFGIRRDQLRSITSY